MKSLLLERRQFCPCCKELISFPFLWTVFILGLTYLIAVGIGVYLIKVYEPAGLWVLFISVCMLLAPLFIGMYFVASFVPLVPAEKTYNGIRLFLKVFILLVFIYTLTQLL